MGDTLNAVVTVIFLVLALLGFIGVCGTARRWHRHQLGQDDVRPHDSADRRAGRPAGPVPDWMVDAGIRDPAGRGSTGRMG